MKLIFGLLICLFFCLASINGQIKPAATTAWTEEQTALRKLDQGIFFTRFMPMFSGVQMKEPSVSFPLLKDALADDYSRIDPKGRLITKAQELTKQQEFHLPTSRNGRVSYDQIQIAETMALVKSQVTIQNSENDDIEPNGQYRVTNVYRKENGKWLLFSSQWTTVQP